MQRFRLIWQSLLFLTACLAVVALGATWQLGSTDDPVPGYQIPGTSCVLQDHWYLVRDAVDANDPNLTATLKVWGGVTLSPLRRDWNTVTLAFLAYGDGNGVGDPNGGSFDFEIYGCRQHSSLELVCSGDANVGELKAACLPFDSTGALLADPNNYKWVEGDPNLIAAQSWGSTVTGTTDANGLGKIEFDPQGCPYIYVRLFGIANLTTIYPLITGR